MPPTAFSLNKMLSEPTPPIHIQLVSGGFPATAKNRVVATACPAKPEIFAIWPFTGEEKPANP